MNLLRIISTESRATVRKELYRYFEKYCLSKSEIKDLSTSVSILTTGNLEKKTFKLILPKKLKLIYILAIKSHFFPETERFLVQQAIRDKVHRYGHFEERRILVLLSNKVTAIEYILESNLFGIKASEVFGNLIALKNKNLIKIVFFDLNKRKVNYPEFHRGYRDHGSRVLSHCRHSFYQGSSKATEDQLSIDEERKISEETFELLLGFLE